MLYTCLYVIYIHNILWCTHIWKYESETRSVMSDSLWPHGLYSPWNCPGQNTGVGSLSLLQGTFPTQGSNPGILHRRRILLAEPQRKPKNTGVGSLSLLQWIFPTQGLIWGLLHCRWILYQLSYQGYVCANTKCGEGEVMLVFLLWLNGLRIISITHIIC